MKRSPFFDHSLKTVVSPSSVPSTQDDPIVIDDVTSSPDDSAFASFKKGMLSLFRGISTPILEKLFDDYKGSDSPLAEATNAYLDNPDYYKLSPFTNVSSRKHKAPSLLDSNIVKKKKLAMNVKPSTSILTISEEPNDDSCVSSAGDVSDNWRKYIGSFDVDCWCTRTVVSSSLFGDGHLIFEVHKTNDNVVYIKLAETGRALREIGRVNEDVAVCLGPLLRAHILYVTLEPYYFPGGIMHIGDTFIMQVHCFVGSVLFSQSDNSNKNLLHALKYSEGNHLKSKDESLDAFTIRKRTSIFDLFRRVGISTPAIPRSGGVKNAQIVDLSDSGNDDQEDLNSNEFTMNKIKDLYGTNQSAAIKYEWPETSPSDFNLELRPYQKHGLSWMLHRENEDKKIAGGNLSKSENDIDKAINPLYREYKWPSVPKNLKQYEVLKGEFEGSFYINLYDGSCSFKRPTLNSGCVGGILADEMGLGKTITTLSLIFSCPYDTHITDVQSQLSENRSYASGTTLIVVPMALLSQWDKEFTRVNGSVERHCFVYYGTNIVDNLPNLLCNNSKAPTVILTTYGIVQSEWSRIESKDTSKGLYSVDFFRIILDEGHIIRNRSTKTARAIYALGARRKWILTGTPIVNRLEDLYSLIRFLNFEPWSNHFLWKHFITAPFDTGKDLPLAFTLLKSILDPILLRRTKGQRGRDGKLLVELPPKEVVLEELKFNEKEEILYNWLKARAVTTFNENFRKGLLLKNYSSILTQLLRLRQVCDHIDLIKTQDTGDACGENEAFKDRMSLSNDIISKEDKEALAMIKSIEQKEIAGRMSLEEMKHTKTEIYKLYPNFDGIECSICTGPIDPRNCVITECKHCFCASCLKEHFDFQEQHQNILETEYSTEEVSNVNSHSNNVKVLCPMCRAEIKKNRLFKTVPKNLGVQLTKQSQDMLLTQVGSSNSNRQYTVRPFDPYGKSSKLNALLSHLDQIREESPGDHVIVFSQFTSFLDIIEKELANYGSEFVVYKFDGRLSMEERQKVLTNFEKECDAKKSIISILLLSLRAGGVGLNLTVASKAFLLDPHWNNAVEFQAIDRLHRVGQKKSVKVVRFVMQGSIEERMLDIQTKKNRLGEALTLNDEERRKKRIQEIQSIFKD